MLILYEHWLCHPLNKTAWSVSHVLHAICVVNCTSLLTTAHHVSYIQASDLHEIAWSCNCAIGFWHWHWRRPDRSIHFTFVHRVLTPMNCRHSSESLPDIMVKFHDFSSMIILFGRRFSQETMSQYKRCMSFKVELIRQNLCENKGPICMMLTIGKSTSTL